MDNVTNDEFDIDIQFRDRDGEKEDVNGGESLTSGNGCSPGSCGSTYPHLCC